jgi:hypothetical protein
LGALGGCAVAGYRTARSRRGRPNR